jgi:hypothetical protein
MVVLFGKNIDNKKNIETILKTQLQVSANRIAFQYPDFAHALYFINVIANDKNDDNVVMVTRDIHRSNEYLGNTNGRDDTWFNIKVMINLNVILGEMHVFVCYLPQNSQFCIDVYVDEYGVPYPDKKGQWVFADFITYYGFNMISMNAFNNYMMVNGIRYKQTAGRKNKKCSKKIKNKK